MFHSAVEAALNLVRDHGPFDANAIARVDTMPIIWTCRTVDLDWQGN